MFRVERLLTMCHGTYIDFLQVKCDIKLVFVVTLEIFYNIGHGFVKLTPCQHSASCRTRFITRRR